MVPADFVHSHDSLKVYNAGNKTILEWGEDLHFSAFHCGKADSAVTPTLIIAFFDSDGTCISLVLNLSIIYA